MPSLNAARSEQIVDTYIPKAATDMTAGQGCVLASTGVQHIEPSVAASVYLLGVLAYDALALNEVRVVERGQVEVQVKNGETWAINDKIGLAAAGQFTKVTTGNYFAVSQGTTTGGTGEKCFVKLLGHAPATFA